ncbi:MAG: primosomal protein N' [Saprospiraceae bacterium]|uniref:Replication restart protein PriA n=1 Tax=Candidatus Opimibacter skivensis TaxID=2982028 RepID=A0A9D7SXZ3_9BACT|nr:primosomal protein N' [Candidatus Opimibacter skivensis]
MPSVDELYAEILLPLALEGTYTYNVPPSIASKVTFGVRVEVQFGSRKRYAGLVINMTSKSPATRTKEIISVLDETPLIQLWQYKLWLWMAGYYCCTPGEVMKAALPGATLLSSETIISPLPVPEDEILQLANPLYDLMRILQARPSLSLDELEKESGLKVLYPHIITLYKLGMIVVVERLAEKYVSKKIKQIQLSDAYATEQGLHKALDLISTKENQLKFLLSYLSLAGEEKIPLDIKDVLTKAEVENPVVKSLVKKGIFKEVTREINRMDRFKNEIIPDDMLLSVAQQNVYESILHQWQEKEVVLLHGVTGSGKTIIYTKLIEEVIKDGGQVLYLVPEIGLSVQIMNRLIKKFGNQITISHSRLSEHERVDLWNQVKEGIPIIAGVRSSIFLPFQNLKLIIVDEEHDTSYKQQDPNPRYHARDVAIYLAQKSGAKVLLGSATPSIESYFHSESGKYGKTFLSERFLGMELPIVTLIDKRKDKSAEGSPYSHTLIESIKTTLSAKKQVIIFKNRRGYSPVLKCNVCEWIAECNQCDISLTYHKGRNKLVCHVCGTVKEMISLCPACGSPRLSLEGYGTEKIEDELSVIFPESRIRRMDLDTTRGKNNLENLIYDFERGKIDILVGTQMVTKGLDFDHVGLVGVIYADQALHYPDFRSAERTFQTLVQVSGRAGRKHEQGNVMIQTFQPEHPVFLDVINSDYSSFYKREIKEREIFRYPPFVRQIAISIKHRQADISRDAADLLVTELKPNLGKRILGPSVPAVARVRNQYIHMVYIKIERDAKLLADVKQALKTFQQGIVKRKLLSTVRISIDVDPYH